MKKASLFLLCAAIAATGCSKFGDDIIDPWGPDSNSTAEAKSYERTGNNTVNIADSEPEEDLIANTEFDRTISIVFAPSGATVSGDKKGIVTINGNQVTVDNTSTKEKVMYKLSGSASDGFFKVYSKNKQAIVLDGLDLTNPNGAAINNQGKKRCFVVVNGSNSLSDGSKAMSRAAPVIWSTRLSGWIKSSPPTPPPLRTTIRKSRSGS